MDITPNEKALILAIRDSEYNDDHDTSPVWVNCIWGFQGKAKFGGTMASLTKKGLAGTDGETAWLAPEALALVKDEPHIDTFTRAKALNPDAFKEAK